MDAGSAVAQFFPLVMLFAIFYFLIIRPQQKQQKAHTEMIKNLTKGDKIITSGGLIADIVKVEEEFIKIKLNDSNIVRLDRNFVTKKVELLNEKA